MRQVVARVIDPWRVLDLARFVCFGGGDSMISYARLSSFFFEAPNSETISINQGKT